MVQKVPTFIECEDFLLLFIVTIQTPSPYIRKTARQVVLSRCYAANFAHIWGGDPIRATLRIR